MIKLRVLSTEGQDLNSRSMHQLRGRINPPPYFIPTKDYLFSPLEGDILLVCGGSKSGKSKLMEVWAQKLAEEHNAPLIYLASLEAASDEENIQRIRRHQKQRAGRGFTTIERARDLGGICEQIPEGSVILLECLSTWLANELFSAPELPKENPEFYTEKYYQVLGLLKGRSRNLILSANSVFSDAISLGEGSLLWREVMALLLQKISAYRQCYLIEVAAGIPFLYSKSSRY